MHQSVGPAGAAPMSRGLNEQRVKRVLRVSPVRSRAGLASLMAQYDLAWAARCSLAANTRGDLLNLTAAL